MRGGGKRKDKKSKVEKKQVTRQEPVRREGPAILESEREAVIRMLEESEEYRKVVENVSGGSDIEVERKTQNWVTTVQEGAEVDKGKMRRMECGLRLAVEARRKGRREEQEQRRHDEQEQSGQQEAGQRRQGEQGQNSEQEQSEQGKQVGFGQED